MLSDTHERSDIALLLMKKANGSDNSRLNIEQNIEKTIISTALGQEQRAGDSRFAHKSANLHLMAVAAH